MPGDHRRHPAARFLSVVMSTNDGADASSVTEAGGGHVCYDVGGALI
jgi:hypothetical protein